MSKGEFASDLGCRIPMSLAPTSVFGLQVDYLTYLYLTCLFSDRFNRVSHVVYLLGT